MHRRVIAGAVVAVGLGATACAPASTVSPSGVPATTRSATALPASATASAATPSPSVRTGLGLPASATATPSEATTATPGAVLDPHAFASDLNATMAAESSYRSTTHTVSTPVSGASATANTADVTTVVDQRDSSQRKLRTESGGSTPSVLILIGTTQYVQTGSEKFHKATLSQASADALFSVGDDIDAAATSVTYVGPEDLQGELARHYTAAMPAAVGAPSAGQSPQSTGEPVSYDVWLDSQGRLLKIVSTASFLTTTRLYTDYGTAPEVTAPDPSEVEG